MRTDRKQALRETLAALASNHAVVVEQLELIIRLLSEELAEDVAPPPVPNPLLVPTRSSKALLDRDTFCVHCRGRVCYLGNTLLFRFFERISRSPNKYVSYSALLDDVWGGPRDHASIRGVAKRLRDRLASHGMAELSESVDGTNPGYYGLILSQPDLENQTQIQRG